MTHWLATLMVLVPLGGALLVWLLPMPREWVGPTALLVALAEIGFWIWSLISFDFSKPAVQLQQQTNWIKDLHISYHVGIVFGFSLWLIGMAVVVMTAAIAYALRAGRERPSAYYGLMLFLMAAVVGVFVAQDLLLFYVFWEAMLIPLYFLIGVWGGAGRIGATIKFFIYTMAGSLLMLAAVIAYGLSNHSFDLIGTGSGSNWIFLGFIAAFAVKAPLFPFHAWLPDAYRESPPEVAAVLSGVVSKAAAYGFLWIAILHFPEPAKDFRIPILVLAAIGLVYGSLLAFRAPDFRGVVAYSSLAQLSLIILGLFATNLAGFDGAVLQMVNHGLLSGALFLLAGAIEARSRTATGDFSKLGGMARGRPALATVLMTVGIIALAVPGSSAFAGEFLILAGVLTSGWAWTVIGTIAIVLAAMYMLRLISAVLHRSPGSAVTEAAPDLRAAELAIVVPLVACLLALSAWPAAVTDHSFGKTKSIPGKADLLTTSGGK
jgi:NADH-quinone oxidoreductase subunit M